MKSILIFVVGALVGATGLFYALHNDRLTAPVALAPAALEPLPYGAVTVAARTQEPSAVPPAQTLERVASADAPSGETQVEPSISPEALAPEPPPEPSGLEQSQDPDPFTEPLPAHAGGLLIPVAGIAPTQLQDTFHDMRGTTRGHEAIDIMAALKTPVYAVDDGTLVKLFDSKPGGLTLYQYDPSSTFAYYYAHLDGYAAGLVEGQAIKRGDLLGYVGVTGNANPLAPHLHFAVFVLGPEKRWWKGTAINPYPLFAR
ncbi:M23 family metallopeptidase [Pseudomonas sp. XK-1]|uniref:M23 family metallopeptidase n=1 Tax=Pseudomonas sp. XK-1 TaxID=3136019 RepID=UPI003119E93A